MNQRKQRVQKTTRPCRTLYIILWIIFFAYTASLAYFFITKQSFDRDYGATTIAYLVIIALLSFYGGVEEYWIAIPLVASFIVFGTYGSAIGAVILDYYIVSGRVDNGFNGFLLQALGTSDFFVIKLMSLFVLVDIFIFFIFRAFGKSAGKKYSERMNPSDIGKRDSLHFKLFVPPWVSILLTDIPRSLLSNTLSTTFLKHYYPSILLHIRN